MKYKRKDIIKYDGASDRNCVDEASYNLFTTAYAQSEAQAQANRRIIGQTMSNGGCTWSTRAEVRNAYFDLGAPDYGFQPKPRCQTVTEPGPGFDPIGGNCPGRSREETKEYTPGGTKPPCQNNIEGSCAKTNENHNWSSGSSWQTDPNFPPSLIDAALSYEFRVVPNSIISRRSGSTCTRPQPGPWQRKIGGGNTSIPRPKAKVISEIRCFDTTKHYDCCCNCGKKEVPEVSLLSSGAPASCPSLVSSSQQQIDALKSALEGALIAGACLAAAAILAKMAVIAAVPVAAGCAVMYMSTIEAPCEDTGNGS